MINLDFLEKRIQQIEEEHDKIVEEMKGLEAELRTKDSRRFYLEGAYYELKSTYEQLSKMLNAEK